MTQHALSVKRAIPLLIAIVLSTTGCGGDSPESMLTSAKDYLGKNDPAAATIQLKNVLAKQPNSAEARFLLGRALLESGDAITAEVELRKAIELKYDTGQVAPLLARTLLAQGQFKKVTDELTNTPTSSPQQRADLLTSIGTSHALQGNKDAAQAAFKEAVSLQAGYAPALLGMARLKAADSDLTGAMEIVERTLADSPNNADVWHFKADLLRVTGKLADSLAAYEKALAIKPSSLSAHAASIMIHLREQKPELAQKQLGAMQKSGAKHPLTLYMQGLVAYAKKDLPAVRTAMEALLKAQPDNPQGLQLAGIVAYESRADLQAQEYLSKALQKVPSLEFGRRILVLSYLRSKQPTKALASMQPVLHDSNTSPTWLALAGEVHMQNGNLQTAEDFFKRATQADPKNTSTQTALAVTRMQMGRVDQAVADLEQIAAADTGVTADMALISSSMQTKQFDLALKSIANFEKKQSDNPAVFNLRGLALLGKGDAAGARKNFEQALSLNAAYLPAASSLAQMDLAEKQPAKARQRFEAVLGKEPQNFQAMLTLARLDAQAGVAPDEIAKLIGKAIAAAPNEAGPRVELISHHIAAKNNDKARTAVQEALAALPDRPEILDVAGRVYQLTGDTQQALSMYGKLASLLPNAAQPYLRMAEIELAAGRKEQARNSLNKGLSLQQNSFPMLRALIMLDVDDKRFEAALSKARDIQKSFPKASIGQLIEGDIHSVQKDWRQAGTAYRSGLKVQSTTELAERLYAVTLQGGQAGEASAFANTWLKDHPKDHAFRMYLAESANKRKDYDTAVAQYRQLLTTQANSPAILNNLAWSLGQKNDPKAISTAEQALQLAPNQPAIMDTLAMLLSKEGKDMQRSIELLSKAVKLAPQAADIRLNYAKVLLKAGNKAAAIQELKLLAKLDDKHPLKAEITELQKGL